MTSPSSTVAPSSTATLTMVPCIGEATESPETAAPALFPPERFGFFAPRGTPAHRGQPGREHDLEPAPADLDGDLVALVGLVALGQPRRRRA